MEWKVTSAEVWLSSIDVSFERESDGLHQRLFILIDGNKMHVSAYQWLTHGKVRCYRLHHMERRHVISQEELSALWNEVYFNGEED